MTPRETASSRAAVPTMTAASSAATDLEAELNLSPEIASLAAELRKAHEAEQRLRKEIEDARTERWRTEIRQEGRIRELERLNQEQARLIEELRASTSWRITQPLRQSSAWLSRQRARSGQLLQALKNGSTDAAEEPLGSAEQSPSLTIDAGYAEWLQRFEALSEEDIRLIRAHIESAPLPPLRVVWSMGDCNVPDLRRAMDSLRRQYHTAWTARLLVESEALAAQFASSPETTADPRIQVIATTGPGEHGQPDAAMLCIEGPGSLAPHALYLMAEAAGRHPQAVVLADDDVLTPDGTRAAPRFLPRYSAELPATGSIALVPARHASAALSADDGSLRSMVMRAVGATGAPPVQVPFIAFHASRPTGPLVTTREDAILQDSATQPLPFVTIVIPTRDRFDLMRPCLSSILERTDYAADRFEIVVVDNGSVEPELLAYLATLEKERKIRVIQDPRRFNYARLNNLAVAQSRGDLLAFVNNDIEVHDPKWLRRLAFHAHQPDVGAVGAKLLYPDHTVQHGGVILGIQGVAAHAHHQLAEDAPGYLGLSVNTHAISAITGACLMVRRSVFEEVGGFNEDLAVAFNDTLLCMDIKTRGYRNMYVAHPLLIHYESKTRGLDDTDTKRALFRREARYARSRHRALFKNDPYYNPNLSLERPYELAAPPRQSKPWHVFRRQSNGRMRLLILSVTHQIGHGVPVVVDIHARHLAQEGHEVIVGGPKSPNDFVYAGCRRAVLDTPQEAAIYAMAHGIDCVIMHTPPFFSTMRWLGDGVRTLVYDHGEPPPDLFPDAEMRRLQLVEKDFCLEMADALYANSQATRDDSGHRRMGVIPLGNTHLAQWDESMLERRRLRRVALDLENRIVVLNVCRFHENERYYKGIDDYCAVKDRLEAEAPDLAGKFVFVLAGKGSEEDVEEMESRGLRVFANVSDREMLDLYCCADLYANFSRWEGYNLGIGQALAMGLEVVASDIPAHRSFPIFTSSNLADQARKLAELGSATMTRPHRIARSSSWDEPLAQLSSALARLMQESPTS